jgi:polyvinyl alcohol dehydrogenase (cytochrome)
MSKTPIAANDLRRLSALPGTITRVLLLAGALSTSALAQQPDAKAPAPPTDTELGFGIFQKNCTSCHGNPAVERAPTPAQLREFTADRIYAALTTGVMKTVGDTLNDVERRQVAASLAGKPLGSAANGDADRMPNRCASNPMLADPESLPQWNGWGAGLANDRFQPQSQAQLGDVRKLKLKWVFGLPNATSSYSQPTVVAGRVFVGADTGYIYSLDAATGCVYWSYQAGAGVRNAMTIGAISGHSVRGLFW